MRSTNRWPPNPRLQPIQNHALIWNRVLLVVDDPASSPGLVQLVRGQQATELCSVTADPKLILRKISALKPDVVVLDVALVGRGGLDLFNQIKARHPAQSVVMLSMRRS